MSDDGSVVGLAFQNLPGADNIGYLIPTPIIERFLGDIRDVGGRHGGFCSLGIKCQAMENPQMRRYLRMPPDRAGVLVNSIQPLSKAVGIVQKDDVLLAVDGVPVANDGSIPFRGHERVSLDYPISIKRNGETVRLELLRDGDVREVDVAATPLRGLIPVHRYDLLPAFFVYAGLVFVPLSLPHLHEYGDDWFNNAPRRLVDRAMNEVRKDPGQEVVILSVVLVDAVNAGYSSMADLEVKRVNGEEVRNLRHLRELVERCGGPGGEPYVRFDLADDRVLVLDAAEAAAAHPRILRRHRVPEHMSACLDAPPEEPSAVSS